MQSRVRDATPVRVFISNSACEDGMGISICARKTLKMVRDPEGRPLIWLAGIILLLSNEKPMREASKLREACRPVMERHAHAVAATRKTRYGLATHTIPSPTFAHSLRTLRLLLSPIYTARSRLCGRGHLTHLAALLPQAGRKWYRSVTEAISWQNAVVKRVEVGIVPRSSGSASCSPAWRRWMARCRWFGAAL